MRTPEAGQTQALATREYCVVAFSNTSAAIQGRQVLERAGVNAFLMPTPREITASCGLSLRLPIEMWRQTRKVLDASDMCHSEWSFYRLAYGEYKRVVLLIDND